MPALLFFFAILTVVALALWLQLRRARRAEFIRSQPLPRGLYAALRQRHPGLSERDCALVGQALRQFFLAWLRGGLKPISMPSTVADDLWHAFILDTRAYKAWCEGAFGRFFHHSPATALSSAQPRGNEGLRRCWWQCCKAENIDPRNPRRLPLLFALDRKLGIAGGHFYVLPAIAAGKDGGDGSGGGGDTSVECFADSSIDGTTDGLGDGGSSGGDGGGDGGGCGGGE